MMDIAAMFRMDIEFRPVRPFGAYQQVDRSSLPSQANFLGLAALPERSRRPLRALDGSCVAKACRWPAFMQPLEEQRRPGQGHVVWIGGSIYQGWASAIDVFLRTGCR